ncbi:MAG: hypothetical protein AAF989_12170, partial [Planctomycetota bacterium]
YLEAMEVQREAALNTGSGEDDDVLSDEVDAKSTSAFRPRTGPLEQLHHLQEEMSRQRHWIKRRRSLKEKDDQYKKTQSGHARTIERCEQQRRALWAKCGVATPEQFYELVDAKALLREMRDKHTDLGKQVRKIIGGNVEFDDVAHELDGATANDLEKRWEALGTRLKETEDRIANLRTQQGEISQEMKQLGEDGRLTTAQLELGCVERQIAAVCRRWQTLAMASSLLEDVCNTFERERQPETLREASSFLSQLTEGKYTRIWTPLGTNKLRIDDCEGGSLPLEVLSRGTGEAVFIALRLSLAAAYSRRGVNLPLVLDDVLVNFDRERAVSAAKTLRTFAELGHQVMMFTCHEHIVDIFHDIEVEVRQLPAQGEPGRASILLPELEEQEEIEEEVYEEEIVEEPVAEIVEEIAPEPRRKQIVYSKKVLSKPEPKTVVVEKAAPVPPPAPQRAPKPAPIKREPAYEYVEEVEYLEPAPSIGWAWYEREPADGKIDADEINAELDRNEWSDEESSLLAMNPESKQDPDDPSWWNGSRMAAS